jgi:membrane protein YdbS with pleckstrin-like domain
MRFTTDNLPPQFDAVLDHDEKVLWVGNPTLVPFLLSGVPLLVFGILWGSFDYFMFIKKFIGHSKAGAEAYGMLAFFAVHMIPCWLGIGNMLRLCLVFGNTCYSFTNKRILLRTGFLGIDFKSIDFDRLQEIDVTVNPIENMLGVGSLKMFSGGMTAKGAPTFNFFIGIEKPYEVYKQLKTITVDVKTDWNYPNALRPSENKGYKTDYSPE